jgi:type VI secretion system protein VasD
MLQQKIIIVFLILLSTALLTGCSVLPNAMLPTHRLILSAQTDRLLNPDEQGRAGPLVVSLIQLKTADTFQSAEFDAVYKDPKTVLAADFVALSQITLQPNTTGVITLNVLKDVKFIGVIGVYQNPALVSWRYVIPVTSTWGVEKMALRFTRRGILEYDPLAAYKFNQPNVSAPNVQGSIEADAKYKLLSS